MPNFSARTAHAFRSGPIGGNLYGPLANAMNATHTPKLKKFTEVMQIRGVRVYLHWSVILIGCVILLGAFERPAATLAAWAGYFGVLLIHESGHLIAAQRLGYSVNSIQLYPIFGITWLETPRSRFDAVSIAWAGVFAQAVIAIPLVALENRCPSR